MGLAASQARFLAITARKADCEFRSMQIAQNKLSVTRELQAATEKYQNAMNAEMLVWDYDGTASDLQALSYGIMTKPSVYNNFTPYLLTDRGGRVIVSPEIAAAARAAGIDPDKGGQRTEAAFTKFIEALGANDVISTQTVRQMKESMLIVNNPSNQYVGINDGHGYTAAASCPYAVPVYVKAGTNAAGDTVYTYKGPVLKENPGLSYHYNFSNIQSINADISNKLKIAVPVYVDEKGNLCKDGSNKIYPVLKENPYYGDHREMYTETKDGSGNCTSRTISSSYYAGAVNTPPANAHHIDYIYWASNDLNYIGSPMAIIEAANSSNANVKLKGEKVAIYTSDIDVEKYYMGERNSNTGNYDIAYAIYTGTDKKTYNSPANILAKMNPTTGQIVDPKIQLVGYTNYDPNNGYGAEPMSKNALKGMNLSQLAYALKNGGIVSAYQDIELTDVTLKGSTGQLIHRPSGYKSDESIGFSAQKGGSTYSEESFDVISLSDVLTSSVVVKAHHKDGDHAYHGELTAFTEDFLKKSVIQIGIALGAFKEGMTDPSDANLYKDDEFGQKFYMAYEFTKSQFCSTPKTIATPKNGDSDTQSKAVREALNRNSAIFYQNTGGDYNSTAAVSLSNMMDYFLTYVTILEDGFDSGYAAMDNVADSNFVTNDPNYRWVVDDEETEKNEAVMKSDFYMQLFNNLCINGYKVDQRVQGDNDYLEQMLKNGSFFISSLSRDGHFYQSRYNDSEGTLIKVVADEDAIAVAESEYNYMKIKLTAKEDKLDLDMKNIDMEISALTTEYDSVKNLISKSIEKTFKQFEG